MLFLLLFPMETISLNTATARSQEGVIYVSSLFRWAFSEMNLCFIPVGLSKLTSDLSTEPSVLPQPHSQMFNSQEQRFPSPWRPLLGMHSEPDGKLQNVLSKVSMSHRAEALRRQALQGTLLTGSRERMSPCHDAAFWQSVIFLSGWWMGSFCFHLCTRNLYHKD